MANNPSISQLVYNFFEDIVAHEIEQSQYILNIINIVQMSIVPQNSEIYCILNFQIKEQQLDILEIIQNSQQEQNDIPSFSFNVPLELTYIQINGEQEHSFTTEVLLNGSYDTNDEDNPLNFDIDMQSIQQHPDFDYGDDDDDDNKTVLFVKSIQEQNQF